MNAFDSTIIHFLNQFAFRWKLLDLLALAMTKAYVLRGLPMITLLWWIWFRDRPDKLRDREIVITTIVASVCVLALGRLLAYLTPFRLRPFANPELGLQFLTSAENKLQTWNAFPSDHAMLWCAVATGVFVASRRVGFFALAYAILFISMTRVYVGLHHPTDVLAGIALGVSICLLLNLTQCRQLIATPVLRFSREHQCLFHVGMFLLSFGMVTHFDELLKLGSSFLKYI